jgi:hypothetical protein
VPASPGRGINQETAAAQVETYDSSYAWLADLPEDITVETLKVDPRTGLHFVELPPVIRQHFAEASKAVLHFFAVVRKPTKSGELVKRVVLIGDQALYLCTPNGVVKRCIDVADIDEMLLDNAFGLGIRCHNDIDLAFACVTGEHRQEIVDVLQRVFKYSSGGRAIPTADVPRHQRMEAFLKLTKPPGYKMSLTPFRPRQELVDAIREKRDIVVHNAPAVAATATSGAMPADLKISEEQYVQMRAQVAREMDYGWRQDPALVQIRAQIDALDRQLIATKDEEGDMQRQIDEHSCEDGVALNPGSYPAAPGSGIMPTSGPGTFRRRADGLFFVKVEPEIINCELDVVQVCMNANTDTFFTGHTNGFVSMWDCSVPNKTKFVHTFREHTGKITRMNAVGNELVTASADAQIRLWDINNRRCRTSFTSHRGAGAVHAMHRSGPRLVTGGQDGLIHVWDLERAQNCAPVSTMAGHHSGVRDLKFDDYLMVSVEWGWALVWDFRSNRVVRSFKDEHGGINCVDYADGVAVAGGCGGDMTVWDIQKRYGDTVSAHDDDVLCCKLVGKNAITTGGDHTMRMWDLAGMKSLGVFHEAHPYDMPSFAVEGKQMVAATGPFVKLWSKAEKAR